MSIKATAPASPNRLVALRAPTHLVLERLDFSGSCLSCQMNRLLASCAGAVPREKLKALKEQFGITRPR